MNYFIREPSRETPITLTADVVVAGGGPAGVGAAVAAAREGANVVLLERYGYLGGLATGGLVILLCGLMDGENRIIGGLIQEIIDKMPEYSKALRQGYAAG